MSLSIFIIEGKTEFFSFIKVTNLGGGKILNSKPDKFCLAYRCTILLLSAYSKSVTHPTLTFTTVNKLPV